MPPEQVSPPNARQRRALRIGIDVGGTFTDLAAVESWSGRRIFRKVPSTPREPARAVLETLAALLAPYAQPPEIELLAHSTTIATNALLGQIGLELPRTALVTTHGFRDVIEIGRQNRSELYNLFVERPRPLVARGDRLTVRERIDFRGNVLQPLEDAEVERVCAELHERDVAAVAICLLHAYANDAHEHRIEQAVARALPQARVTRSSRVDPQYREYERFSTTVVNAVLAPIVETYLERLLAALHASGLKASLYVTRSDGGLTTVRGILDRPAALIESGPASGVIAAAELGRGAGISRILCFDMGGTTAKAGAIVDGTVQIAREFEAAGATHSGRAVRGSGYPVRFPFVDLAEISAGGGTIAFIDAGGSLRVGPLSAGADPGPACYGRSDRATVTDADVVLGRLNPDALLGGTFPIEAARARVAVDALARQLEMDRETCAAGIVALVDHAMAKVLRIVTVERGLDPRRFTLVAFGGGGPLHACALAEELDVERVIVPMHPGCFSARGLLGAQLHLDRSLSILECAAEVDYAALERWFADGEAQARETLAAQGSDAKSITFRREYDARYRGQSFELAIAGGGGADAVAARFHAAHRARYGYDVPAGVVELVNARVTAYGALPSTPHPEPAAIPDGTAPAETRSTYLQGAFVDVPVLQRDALFEGARVSGPAIVEEYDCTTYVPPNWRLTAERSVLVLERRQE